MGAVRLSFVLKEILVKHRLFTPQLAESCGVFFCPIILQACYNEQRLYHKVEKGETLYSIARKRGVSVETLCELNHINKTLRVRQGQILRYS